MRDLIETVAVVVLGIVYVVLLADVLDLPSRLMP